MQVTPVPVACGVQARAMHRLRRAVPGTSPCCQDRSRSSIVSHSYGPTGQATPAHSVSRRQALALLPAGAALVLGVEAAGPGARGAQAKVSIAEVVKGNGKNERDIQVTARWVRPGQASA